MSPSDKTEPFQCAGSEGGDDAGRLITVEVIHDFKNILAGILGNLALAKDWSDPKDKAYPFIEAAERVTRHANQLTLQLLAHAKGSEWEKSRVCISRLLRECVDLMVGGSPCHVKWEIDPDLRTVDADEARLTQVFNNLLINARQAMEKGGMIEVTVNNVDIGPSSGHRLDPGVYVRVSIRDEGCGIRKDHIEHLFKPNFTTKKDGNGIGLASCYYIVKNHGGVIEVDSEEGQGARFSVYLPAGQSVDPHAASREEAPVRGYGSILVMDDDAMIQQTIGDMLDYLGFQAHFADDGHEALRVYRKAKESGNPFRLVMMDLTIPGGMGGLEAIRKLKEYDKDVVAVVSSGHPNDPVMQQYERFGFRAVIRKPYTLRDLEDVIRQTLG
ncbi:MAG: Blue-light-activated protein [Verrucomicrobia bacterium ADurb.Bin474]|nr:MAG: Blue-light-activated protein [Verrucomicrobia bacterium ADurb.Bin474]